ncbi:hypothetical protein SAMN05444008_114108 [Cnuella takakiae]|uniref:Uncharacterized protein n=1 Tax=Cnuella takakiae TaxID=1302690 RepID=A0A1M5FQ49_9BACT|nr:hypothetical protein [Cnuella takakiae]OLY93676.1 hypothetical protein BUE76_18670 [Cnuella takakiae]SHF93616.1 hypothetical protein SAMN05444008_114108 [Cnuella takakiae]
MLFINPNTLPYQKSLTTCLNRATQEGYIEEFYLHQEELRTRSGNRRYEIGDVEVLNCFHFEGKGQEGEEAYLLIMQTADGTKGTLVTSGEDLNGFAASLFQNCQRH